MRSAVKKTRKTDEPIFVVQHTPCHNSAVFFKGSPISNVLQLHELLKTDKMMYTRRSAKQDGFTTTDSTHFVRPYVISPAILTF